MPLPLPLSWATVVAPYAPVPRPGTAAACRVVQSQILNVDLGPLVGGRYIAVLLDPPLRSAHCDGISPAGLVRLLSSFC